MKNFTKCDPICHISYLLIDSYEYKKIGEQTDDVNIDILYTGIQSFVFVLPMLMLACV